MIEEKHQENNWSIIIDYCFRVFNRFMQHSNWIVEDNLDICIIVINYGHHCYCLFSYRG